MESRLSCRGKNVEKEFTELLLEGARGFYTSILFLFIFVITARELLGTRRSTIPIMIYFSVRIMVLQVLLGHVLGYYYGETIWFQNIFILLTYVLAVITYGMHCYTFRGDFLKIAVGTWITEILCMFIQSFSFVLTNLIEGRENIMELTGKPQPGDVLIFIFGFGLFFLFFHYCSPLMRRFQNYRLRHRRILWVLFCSYIILASSTVFLETKQGTEPFVLLAGIVISGGVIILAYILCGKYAERVGTENQYLALQKRLADTRHFVGDPHTLAIEQEKIRMEALLEHAKKTGISDGLKERVVSYIEALYGELKEIYPGCFSDSCVLDGFLAEQAIQLKNQGITFECAMQGCVKGAVMEQDIIRLLTVLFHWCMMERKKHNDAGISKGIYLRGFTVKNQLTILCSMKHFGRKRPPIRAMKKMVKKYNGSVLVQRYDGEEKLIISMNC